MENTSEEFYLVIPQKPDDLSEKQLDKVTGGTYNIPGQISEYDKDQLILNLVLEMMKINRRGV